jgi:hypothetical protein
MDALDDWIARLAAELGLDTRAVDREMLLDVARDAAHAVDRPAAPLTTYLVGLAAGLRGGTPDSARQAAETAQRLTTRWMAPAGDDSQTPTAGAADRRP